MERNNRWLESAHRAAVTSAAVLTVPAFSSLFLANMTPGAAGLMERLMPAWGWLIGAWSASVAYVCGCLVFSTGFRESLLARVSGLSERDEREELVTAKAARSVYLVTLAGFIAAGLIGMVRFNVFAYTRWEGDHVPRLEKVGPYELRRGTVARHAFLMWPSLALPVDRQIPPAGTEVERGPALYYYEGGSVFGPEVSRTFFALALIQILLLHLFARRARA